jgi:hypothetical protein
MVAQLAVIKFHNCLHGGLPCQGTGTSIMEVKLNQQLAWVEQEPLYQIYLDLKKAYDTLDRTRCLAILAGYGVKPNLLCLQNNSETRGRWYVMLEATLGNPSLPVGVLCRRGALSSLMFNVCVDAVVRECLRQMLGDNVAQDRMGEAARNYAVAFFVDDGLVMARCLEWMQSSFTILVTLFKCIGLRTNMAKMKVITCLPGKIQIAQTEERYTAQQAGDATMMKCWRVVCDNCGASLPAESLQSHLGTQHGIYRPFVLNWDLVPEQAAVVYQATESPATSI